MDLARMNEQESNVKGDKPSFKGEGIAIWRNLTKDNEEYLSVQLFGSKGIKVNCFKYKDKKQSEVKQNEN